MHFQGRNPAGQGADMDSRPAGEPTAGPAPMELLLQAAGACTGMDVAFILRKRKLTIDKLEVLLEGVKRDEHPRIYEEIAITYRAAGSGISVEELERAAALSLKTYCSIFGMLQKVVRVTWKCEVIK
jgi:putative redox protein